MPSGRGRWSKPTRQDVRLGLLASVCLAAGLVVAAALWIIIRFEPDGGLLGRPSLITACGGRHYRPDGGVTWTRAQVDGSIAPELTPTIFEPVIGQIPLGALFSGSRDFNGVQVCDTVVFLHVGPDAYEPYALQGGP